jgi:hypothetical protein
MRRLLLAITMITLIPGVASAGGGGGEGMCPGFASGTTVSMMDSCFAGIAHFAPADTTITIVNQGLAPHTLTAVDGSFDTGEVLPGDSYELTIDEPGIYQVFCRLHGTADGKGMAGVLVVGEAEPLPMSAPPIDIAAIRQAMTDENQVVAEALDGQSQAIREVTMAEIALRHTVEKLAASDEGSSTAATPQIVTVPADPAGAPWIPVAAGLAAGISLAVLAMQRPKARQIEEVERDGIPVSAGL